MLGARIFATGTAIGFNTLGAGAKRRQNKAAASSASLVNNWALPLMLKDAYGQTVDLAQHLPVCIGRYWGAGLRHRGFI
jgi:hypothetical protein